MGHTKTYTKVVMSPTQYKSEINDPKLLIGKCVIVKITSIQKWHITGDIINYNPKLEEVRSDHFE